MAEKHPKRPRDLNQWAKRMVDLATGHAQDTPGKVPNRAKGGIKGGKARAKSLTPEERQSIARNAAKKRWER